MVKKVLQNRARTITSVLVKTVDKSSTYTLNLYPAETVELFPWQYTGDIITKVKNGVLKESAASATPMVTVSVERKAPKQEEESREDFKTMKRLKKEKF